MIKEMIKKAAEGIDLTYDEAAEVTREIMTGSTTPAQTAAYLTALHIKGETTDEISASAYVMRDCAPAATAPTPSTFPLSPLWYAQRLALRSLSTATAQPPASAAPPTASRPSG